MPRHLPAIAIVSATALLISGCAGTAQTADSYPDGPIEYIIPYSAGGGADLIGREYSRLLAEELGTSVNVRNSPGGDEVIAINQTLNAKPNGLTLGFASTAGLLVQPMLNDDVEFEYTPLVMMSNTPYGLFVSDDSEYETIDDLVDDAKERPGEVRIGLSNRYGSVGFSALHFQEAADAEFNLVPFSGGAADSSRAALGGEIEAFVGTAPGQVGLAESGDLRALAHTGDPDYNENFPGSQSFDEAGYDVTTRGDYLTIAPTGLPEEVQERLQEATLTVAQSDEWAEASREQRNYAGGIGGEELQQFLTEEEEAFTHSISLAEADEASGQN